MSEKSTIDELSELFSILLLFFCFDGSKLDKYRKHQQNTGVLHTFVYTKLLVKSDELVKMSLEIHMTEYIYIYIDIIYRYIDIIYI